MNLGYYLINDYLICGKNIVNSDDVGGSVLSGLYARQIDPDGVESLDIIASKIEDKSTILDVGVGYGALGKYLAARGGVCDGIESEPANIPENKKFYRQLVFGDLDTINLGKELIEKKYDYIVCADVLEHLRHPQEALKQLRTLLEDKGRMLISVPNVGYAGVVAGLINGEFCYSEEGILDQTHLKFYTRVELKKMLSAAGLCVLEEHDIRRDLRASEFAKLLPLLTEAQRLVVVDHPDALTYQFLMEVVSVAAHQNTNRDQETRLSDKPSLNHLGELFWRADDETYIEANKISINWPISSDSQILTMVFPDSVKDVHELRFDPVDYPYSVRIKSIKLFEPGHKEEFWSFGRGETENGVFESSSILLSYSEHHGLELSCLGTDPHFIVPIPQAICQKIRANCRIEFEISSSNLQTDELNEQITALFSSHQEAQLSNDQITLLFEVSAYLSQQTRSVEDVAVQLHNSLNSLQSQSGKIKKSLQISGAARNDLENRLANSSFLELVKLRREYRKQR